MPRKCLITGKETLFGNNRSKSNRATRRTWKANLKKVKINGKTAFVSVRACKKIK